MELEGYRPIEENPFSQADVRKGFIRKVFLTVLLLLGITLVQVLLAVSTPAYREFQRAHSWVTFLALGLAIALQIVMICVRKASSLFPYNLALLLTFGLLQGYVVSALASAVSEDGKFAVLYAAIATTVLVVALVLFAWKSPTDFTTKWGIVLSISSVLLTLGLCLAFWPSRALQLIYGGVAVLLISFYLVIDVQAVLGRKSYSLQVDEYILGAMLLYVDIVNLFMDLMVILAPR